VCVYVCVFVCLCSIVAARVNGVVEFLELLTPASHAGLFTSSPSSAGRVIQACVCFKCFTILDDC